ncbi:MAG: hypothetical protein O6948_00200 [Deltaproteobacteria bacterium]|nr:hypothetical protein [Deltaproteobacteria bacterium]
MSFVNILFPLITSKADYQLSAVSKTEGVLSAGGGTQGLRWAKDSKVLEHSGEVVRRSEGKRDRKKGNEIVKAVSPSGSGWTSISLPWANLLDRFDPTYVEIQVDNDGSVSISLKSCQAGCEIPYGVTETPLVTNSL